MGNLTQGNVIRELPIDVSSADFDDSDGFFIRADTGGTLVYVPFNNQPTETVTKTIEASAYFIDPVLCRTIISEGTTAADIYVGYGQ